MNISKITIGRLYNLGNYEHIRYEVTVDVAPGESAAQAVRGLENIMAGLKPIEKLPGVQSRTELKRADATITALKHMDEEQFQREYGWHGRTREEITQQLTEELQAKREKTRLAYERAAQAREHFDNLGGASVYTDSKDDWDTDF